MSAVRWAWMICGLLTAVTTEGQQLKSPRPSMTFRAAEVRITQSSCGHTYSVGSPHGNWKRVMFSPDLTCTGKFRCKLTFRLLDSVPLASDICVDYSRMKVHGRKSSLLIEDGSDDGFRERLTERRYPQIENYMGGMAFINKNSSLHLTFRTDCSQPLDQSFVGWMYVFVQSATTGSIYFLDGDSRHLRHGMYLNDQSLVSVRSHVWTDVPLDSPQTSSMRISVFNSARVCIEWNPFVTYKFPRGVHVRVYKTYYNMDRVEFMFMSLPHGNGTVLPGYRQDCYYMRKVFEIVIEVSRDAHVPVEQSWNETELLFEWIFGVDNQGESVYGTNVQRLFPETTTIRLDSTTPINSTGTWTSTVLSFLDRHKVKIGLGAGGVALLVILYCCCRRCCSQRTRAKDPTDPVIRRNTSPPAEVGGRAGADSIPMMARVMPSAPPMNDIEENPLRDCDGPPAYADVFPDKV